MKRPFLFRLLALLATVGSSSLAAPAPRPMENLSRGVIAIHQPDGRVAVSWRLLGTDPDGVAFNLYRKSDPLPGGRSGFPGFGGAPGRGGPSGGAVPPPRSEATSNSSPTRATEATRPQNTGGRGGRGFGFGGDPSAPRRLNDAPLTGATFFVDETANLGAKTSYFVRAIIAGVEQEPSAAFTLPAGAPPLPYLSVPLQPPEGAQPGDASAADLDGDGHYDLVVKFEQRGRDNSQGGPTGTTFLQGYKLDPSDAGFTSRLLWTINLGKNIREGAHYTQFQVYDLDGDGRAEIVCKTADGTIDGRGKVIGDPKADWVQPEGATAKVLSAGRGGEGSSGKKPSAPSTPPATS